jgi:hypothetical protein
VRPEFVVGHEDVSEFDVGGDVEGEDDGEGEGGEGEELLIVFKY